MVLNDVYGEPATCDVASYFNATQSEIGQTFNAAFNNVSLKCGGFNCSHCFVVWCCKYTLIHNIQHFTTKYFFIALPELRSIPQSGQDSPCANLRYFPGTPRWAVRLTCPHTPHKAAPSIP
jgi:hypothetical protein